MTDRCWWVPDGDALYLAYHDTEWGFPVADDVRLFEKLCLEGFQAGLSWRTVLGKRPAFREWFAGFDIDAVAGLGQDDVSAMLQDPGIIRHRGKIEAAIGNAAVAQALRSEFGSLAAFVWQYEDPGERDTARTTSPQATELSRALRRRGWRFLGPTSAYAFSQAVGLVNDHTDDCVIRPVAAAARQAFDVPRPRTSGSG